MRQIRVILLAIVTKFVSCRPDGGPPLSCANMQPEHYNPALGLLSESQTRPSPYRLTARWDKRMRMIRVSVSGDRIQGFLIQGRVKVNEPAIGSFVNITENPDATYQDCSTFTQFGKYSSVTHSNREYQEKLEFYWKPPTTITSNHTNVTFFATLAKNKNIYWVFQQSNTLPLIMEDGTTTGTTTEGNGSSSNKISTVVLLLLTTLVFLLSKY